jgi:hypothetical protein
MKSNSAETVLLALALLWVTRSWPASVAVAGATSSAAGAPLIVSRTLKMLPPDCASGPALSVDPTRSNSGTSRVVTSRAPCCTLSTEQQVPWNVVPKLASKPVVVVVTVLSTARKSRSDSDTVDGD